jgi:hypothetical protein
VSHWWRLGAIRRAAAGELSHAAEVRLRAHLRACAPCRGRYDRMMLLVPPAGVAARERARLEATLPDLGTPHTTTTPASARRQLRWWPLLPVLALTGIVLLLRARGPGSADEVVYRGSGATEAPPALVLALYASRKADPGQAAAPLRLLGELPASGEIFATARDLMQLGYRGPTAAGHLLVLGRDRRGNVHQYLPARGQTTAVPASATEVTPVGPAIDLALHHDAGPVRLVAIFGPRPLPVDHARAALAAWRQGAGAILPGEGIEIEGLLHVDPRP